MLFSTKISISSIEDPKHSNIVFDFNQNNLYFRKVKVTAYNALSNQCDDTPNIMAWGDKITSKNINKIVGVSRDLLKIIPRNTKIYYFDDEGIIHEKIVMDKMSKFARKGTKKKYRIKNSIDVLMTTEKEARTFGVKYKVIFWKGKK